MKVRVKCAICGKEEYVYESRAKKYICCSRECLYKYRNIQSLKHKHKCVCPVCGKVFYLKNYTYNRTSTHCCSKECFYKLKSITFSGEGNHQFGLKGDKNPTFMGNIIHKKNHKLDESLIYVGDWHKGCLKSGRMTLHRYLVEKNHELFDSSFFDEDNGWFYLKKGYEVHHIDGNHTNNDIDNLTILTKSEHVKIHRKLNPRNRDKRTGKFIKKNKYGA